MKLVIATNNPGKLREIKHLLSSSNVKIVALSDVLNKKIDVVENGKIYKENAQIKAKAVGKLTDLPTLADDSGLEVYALDNFPGIKSARWHAGSDAERNQALLEKMRGVDDRHARYVASVCIYYPKDESFLCADGVLEGRIALKPTKKLVGGFGYDPIFIPKGFDRPLAELGDDVKLEISHRTKAINNLRFKM